MVSGFLLLFIGLPASVIWLIVRIVKKKNVKVQVILIPSCIVLSLAFIVIGAELYGRTDEYQQYLKEQENKEQEVQKAKEEELAQKEEELKKREEELELKEKKEQEDAKEEPTVTPTLEPTKEPTEAPSATPVPTPTQKVEEDIQTVFYENLNGCTGKCVKTTIVVSFCSNSDEECYISSEASDNFNSIKVYTNSKNNFGSGEYVTVQGVVGVEEYSGIVIKDADVLETGTVAKETWDSQMQSYIQEFNSAAEKPTYEDLMRYPDSYNGKKIIIQVTITDVEPDGIIFDGKIQANMEGKEVLLIDGREVREPRLQAGDTVTIYGFGDGLATVKEYDKSGIIPKEIDKYNIPQVNIRYIEF